jgi:ABC-type phosphate/phosphonate transport system substrate-binding protein
MRCGVVVIAALVAACRIHPQAAYAPEYGKSPAVARTAARHSFGVPPIGSARSTWERYSPLVSELNASDLGFELRLESGQTVDGYEARLTGERLDFAIVDPVQVLAAEQKKYQVIARAGTLDRVRGVIVVHRDSHIASAKALRGKVIAFASPGDLATLLCQYRLAQAGVNVRRNASPLYTHAGNSALLTVFLRRAAAAGVSAEDWTDYRKTQPSRGNELVERFRTDDLPGPAVMCRDSIPIERQRALQRGLLRLRATAKGRAALFSAGLSGFVAAESASYDEVWEFLGAYRRIFGSSAGYGGAP